jgi:hypothetical protein
MTTLDVITRNKRKRPDRPSCRADRNHSPDLTWLSLVGLLPSRAPLCFTRQAKHTTRTDACGRQFQNRPNAPTGSDAIYQPETTGKPEKLASSWPTMR